MVEVVGTHGTLAAEFVNGSYSGPAENLWMASSPKMLPYGTITSALREMPGSKSLRTTFLLPLAVLLSGLFPAQGVQNLSPLAGTPDWKGLERFQETITRAEFVNLLTNVYAPRGAWKPYIALNDDHARIRTRSDRQDQYFNLRFAMSPGTEKPVPRYWLPAKELPPARDGRPLSGLKIALDPGHIGGRWARMEERWFQIGDDKPVTEGDLALTTAGHLERLLRQAGAEVFLVRKSAKPMSSREPADFYSEAKKVLRKRGIDNPPMNYHGPKDPKRQYTVRWQSELLFYRVSEIRRRAEIVNEDIKPDLTLCLHFNAEEWGDPDNPTLQSKNHLHLLIHGACSRGELSLDDVRYDMLERLLTRTHDEELGVAVNVAGSMAAATGLPAYRYTGRNATQIGPSSYVWARNLLANRVHKSPVVFLEPYVMNSPTVYARIQAGDYKGRRTIKGKLRPSIFREYAESVFEGLLNYYAKARRP